MRPETSISACKEYDQGAVVMTGDYSCLYSQPDLVK